MSLWNYGYNKEHPIEGRKIVVLSHTLNGHEGGNAYCLEGLLKDRHQLLGH